MRYIICVTLLLAFITNTSFAQEVYLSGTVIDTITKKKIPFATLALYNNTELVDGISTDQHGYYELKTNKKFTHIEVSFIGYDTNTILVSEITNTNNFSITLQISNNTLEEVVIEAERTTSELKIDRKVINLGADLQQAGTTILEAFDQISEIQTDLGTGTVSLRGSGNVRLLINGKPSALGAAELLEQIPASSVEKIELITSPSVKYQADGLSGIINVILKKKMNYGLNMDINTSVGTKRYSYGLNGNYNFSFVNVRLNTSQSGREMNSKQTIHQTFQDGSKQNIYTPHDYNGIVRKITSGFDFFINDNNEFSLEFDYTDDYHTFYNNSLYFDLTGREDYNYLRRSAHDHKIIVLNGNYRINLDKKDHYLEFDYNLNTNSNEYPATDYEEGTFLFNENLTNENTLNAMVLDYALPLSDKTNIEMGAMWNGKKVESNEYLDTGNGASNDDFQYNENIFGAYILTKFKIRRFNWQMGLRYENFESESFNSFTNETVDLAFSDLFPSIHLSYRVNENNTINSGYSRRVSRPNIHHINPFQQGNPYFQWETNPNLKPEFSNNFEVNYLLDKNKFNLSSTVFYRYRKQIIEWLTSIDNQGVQTITFDNIGTKKSYGIEMDTKYKLTSFWTTQLTANYYLSTINTSNLITWKHQYQSNIIFKNTFRINKNISTDITYRHTPKRQNSFNYIDPRNRIDFAARVKLLQNKLSASIRIIDVLDQNLFHRTTIADDIERQTTWKFQSQTFGVLLSLNYKFLNNANTSRNRNRKNRDYGDHGVD